MHDMITVSEGFQSSVNIAYDLNNENKLRAYIPTKSALDLLEDILLSTKKDSTDRARILIGAYGKGKSHIVLMILSILMKKDLSLFEKMMPVVKEQRPELYTLISAYYEHNDSILPVIVTGSGSSIEQSLMLALQNTLAEYELQDIMPETNFRAAANKIDDWKVNYPDVYAKLPDLLHENMAKFTEKLLDYDSEAYSRFEKVYPLVTAGSAFNPFVGFDVTEIYSGVIKSLRKKGYSGVYVVYDEFSKYIENHIRTSSENDTKTLQDFAEYASRSGNEEMHIMLISHKEITSYIGKADTVAVDGWRGVSERFRHVYLNNNFTQTYEIIASAIEKDPDKWAVFKENHKADFENLYARYKDHPIFSDLYEDGIQSVLYDCYPLHPVSTFILPRLSERVAQNERTLFTFISASGSSTLSSFLAGHDEQEFSEATPDIIYDYFEPLLRQEVYSGRLHKYHTLTESILRGLPFESLEAKIVKTIALIDILGQYEKLVPTRDEIVGIYSGAAAPEAVQSAIETLIDKKYVIYQKKSNGYLKLKETSGVDVRKSIEETAGKKQNKTDPKKILNNANFDSYMYPSRYNDEKEMTRYFRFEFIDSSEVTDDVDWNLKRENIHADGVAFAVIPENDKEIKRVIRSIKKSGKKCPDCVFVIPKEYQDIEKIVREFDAVKSLMDASIDDKVLFDDYEIVYDDMQEIIRSYINSYTRPENGAAVYIYNGKEFSFNRRSELSELFSGICDKIYGMTPVVNNEVINKEEITSVTRNSRSRIITGLLTDELLPNLGLKGSGQEVSIMRSTLIRTGILTSDSTGCVINIKPNEKLMENMLEVVSKFILSAKMTDSVGFDSLYEQLTSPEYGIGLRKGIIPIYIAAVFHEYLKQIVVRDRNGQIPLNTDTIEQINADPSMFSLSFINWDADKEQYINRLSECLFGAKGHDYNEVYTALLRWYMGLPKYSKNMKEYPDGSSLPQDMKMLMSAIRKNEGSYDILFKRFPEAFGKEKAGKDLAERIITAKNAYDNALNGLKKYMSDWMRNEFCTMKTARCEKMSLTSIIRDWCEKIDQSAFEQIFTDGTSRILSLFRNVTNDEDAFLEKTGRTATDLRLEDWDGEVIEMFRKNMSQYRHTAEEFKSEPNIGAMTVPSDGYELSFRHENGESITRRFEKVETSPRGKLLYNSLMENLESMGQSISEAEKRQILMNVLEKYC